MARLPRGYRLTNGRVENRCLAYDLEIAWWRRILLVAEVAWRVRPTVSFRR